MNYSKLHKMILNSLLFIMNKKIQFILILVYILKIKFLLLIVKYKKRKKIIGNMKLFQLIISLKIKIFSFTKIEKN